MLQFLFITHHHPNKAWDNEKPLSFSPHSDDSRCWTPHKKCMHYVTMAIIFVCDTKTCGRFDFGHFLSEKLISNYWSWFFSVSKTGRNQSGMNFCCFVTDISKKKTLLIFEQMFTEFCKHCIQFCFANWQLIFEKCTWNLDFDECQLISENGVNFQITGN